MTSPKLQSKQNNCTVLDVQQCTEEACYSTIIMSIFK